MSLQPVDDQGHPTSLGPSFVRTLIPIVVSQIIAYLASQGLDAGPYKELLAQLLGAVLGWVYYIGVRVLEVKVKPHFGWLLGVAKTPTYDATSKVDSASPTQESAGPASDLPENTPVVVEPTSENQISSEL